MNSDKLEILKLVMNNPSAFITKAQVRHIATKNNLNLDNPEHKFLVSAKALRRIVNEIYTEMIK